VREIILNNSENLVPKTLLKKQKYKNCSLNLEIRLCGKFMCPPVILHGGGKE
jgi:hypothetical protein